MPAERPSEKACLEDIHAAIGNHPQLKTAGCAHAKSGNTLGFSACIREWRNATDLRKSSGTLLKKRAEALFLLRSHALPYTVIASSQILCCCESRLCAGISFVPGLAECLGKGPFSSINNL